MGGNPGTLGGWGWVLLEGLGWGWSQRNWGQLPPSGSSQLWKAPREGWAKGQGYREAMDLSWWPELSQGASWGPSHDPAGAPLEEREEHALGQTELGWVRVCSPGCASRRQPWKWEQVSRLRAEMGCHTPLRRHWKALHHDGPGGSGLTHPDTQPCAATLPSQPVGGQCQSSNTTLSFTHGTT